MLKEPNFETRGSTNTPEQKNPLAETTAENPLAPEKTQSAEEPATSQEISREAEKKEESSEMGFSAELKEMPKYGFFKRLQRLAGAFTLAGLFLFSPQESVAPEATKEAWAVHDLRYTWEHQPELYREIFEQIKEKGGVSISPQFPETVYKPEEISGEARIISRSSGIPFYNRPEVILGEKFIKENPEKAEKIYEKISTTIKATVRLWGEKRSQGSGVIVRGAGNKLLVLTNAHVCGAGEILSAFFADDKQDHDLQDLRVIAKDEDNDIAVLEIPDEIAEKLHGIGALKIREKDKMNIFTPRWAEETIATVGSPLGFPFAAGIGKRIVKSGVVLFYPDERFSRLELYSKTVQEVDVDWDKASEELTKFNWNEIRGKAGVNIWDILKDKDIFKITTGEEFSSKGDIISGMSGGPIISLDTEGEPELIGINRGSIRERGAARDIVGIGVSADTITKFLKKNNLM